MALADDDQRRAHGSGKERAEALTRLVLRRTKLSPSEAALFWKLFPFIVAAHQAQVWNQLRRRGLQESAAKDVQQNVFAALYFFIVKHGFPDAVPALLQTLTQRKLLKRLRGERRSPESVGLPSSGSEKPRSEPDVERALDLRELERRVLPELSDDHQDVVRTVIMGGLSAVDAAAVLDLPVGTVKSRVIAAKEKLATLAETFVPPSQRGPA